MSEREELSKVISEAVGGWNQNTQAITRVADAILAAGYSKGHFEGTAAYIAPRVVQPAAAPAHPTRTGTP